MKKIVVATHGYFGKELVNSGSLIMGDTLSFGSLSMNEKQLVKIFVMKLKSF